MTKNKNSSLFLVEDLIYRQFKDKIDEINVIM